MSDLSAPSEAKQAASTTNEMLAGTTTPLLAQGSASPGRGNALAPTPTKMGFTAFREVRGCISRTPEQGWWPVFAPPTIPRAMFHGASLNVLSV